MKLPRKMVQVLQSRKFWALIASLAAIITGLAERGINTNQAIQAAIAALAAYMIGTGLDQGTPPANTDQS